MKRFCLMIAFMICAGLISGVFLEGCSCSKKRKRPSLLSLTGEEEGVEGLRTESGLRAGEFRQDIRFRGKMEDSPESAALKEAGRRALKNDDFRLAMEALKKDDYEGAQDLLQRAEGYLPSNEYIQRWQKRVEMYDLEQQGKNRPELQHATKSMLNEGEPAAVLSQIEPLKADPNPFVRRRVNYIRMQALEVEGREDEAAEARGAWLQARDEIGAIDASSRTPAVDMQ